MDQLTPEARSRVRDRNLAYVRDHGVEWLACNVLYATATKSLDEPLGGGRR